MACPETPALSIQKRPPAVLHFLALGTLLLPGCAETFDTNSYQLTTPRIISLESSHQFIKANRAFTATAIAYRDGLFPVANTLDYAWYFPDGGSLSLAANVSIQSITDSDEVQYLGAGPDLSALVTDAQIKRASDQDGDVILAVAFYGTSTAGEPIEERAYLTLSSEGEDTTNNNTPAILGLSRATLPELHFREVDSTMPTDLFTKDVRANMAGQNTGAWSEVGETVRWRLSTQDDDSDPLRAVWMAVDGSGSAFVLDDLAVDWASGVVEESEDGGVVSSQRLGIGHYQIATVVRDDRGGSSTLFFDHMISDGQAPLAPVGLDWPILLKNGERLVWADAQDEFVKTAMLNQSGTFVITATAKQMQGLAGSFLLSDVELGDLGSPPSCLYWPEQQSILSLHDIALGRCTSSELWGQRMSLNVSVAQGGVEQ